MKKNHIDGKEKLTYEQSVFERNSEDNGDFACCIVIPFDHPDFKWDCFEECRKGNAQWSFDEIMITKTDYKRLLTKSNKLRMLNSFMKNDTNETKT